MIRRLLAKSVLRLARWEVHGTPPDRDHIGILLAAPHTSNLDYPLMLASAWSCDINVKYLIKKEAFKGLAKYWLQWTGGIPTDRENPGSLVEDLIAAASSGEAFALVIAPEGTRRLAKGWRSGFYRIAQGADIPLTPTSLDGTSRRATFGPSFRVTGDPGADMDRIRDFYSDKGGMHPSRKSPVRLAIEDQDPQAEAAAKLTSHSIHAQRSRRRAAGGGRRRS